MSNGKFCVVGTSVLATVLVTLGWLIVVLCYLAFGWSQHSPIQNLSSLAISALVFAAIIGVLWTGELGLAPAATILTALGWLSFTLYWIGFVWSEYSLLQNCAVLMVSFLLSQGMVVVFWMAGPTEEKV